MKVNPSENNPRLEYSIAAIVYQDGVDNNFTEVKLPHFGWLRCKSAGNELIEEGKVGRGRPVLFILKRFVEPRAGAEEEEVDVTMEDSNDIWVGDV
jgi:hypothetical protein